MVSHTQPLPDRPAARRASSTTSSRHSATSRRHRSSRSHTGAGSSLRPQNEFPNFAQTGDVEIVVIADGQERRYCLHRLILAQCSGFFEAGTSEEWSKAAPGPGQGPGQWSASNALNSISEDGQSGKGAIRYPPSTNGHTERVRWRYELDWGNKDGEDEVPMLIQRQPQSTLFGGDSNSEPPPVPTKPPPPSYSQSNRASFFRSFTSNHAAMASASNIPRQPPAQTQAPTNPDSDTIRDYDNLFRIFYNYPPILDAANIAESYLQCKSLLHLADMYDALPVTGPRIDHHLLQFQSRLWKQIAKYPPSYLKLGYLARSKVIFAEALVHVVGQWPSGAGQLRHSTLPDAVLDLIEDKVDEMAERKMRAEMKLLKLSVVTSRTGERVGPNTSSAFVDWLALSLFRQWVAENTSPAAPPPTGSKSASATRSDSHGRRSSHRDSSANNNNTTTNNTTASNGRNDSKPLPPPINEGTFYRLLSTGGSSYLTHDECKRFVKSMSGAYAEQAGGSSNSSSSGSRETLKRLERRMDEIKGAAKEIVRPLMRSYLELDVGREVGGVGGLGYLTCTRVEEEDFPWEED